MVSHKVSVFYSCGIPVDGELVLSFNFFMVNMIAMLGWAKVLMVVHCCAMVKRLFFFFFFLGCLFYHPSVRCTLLHFLVRFNDFQLFIIQRKAGSRRLWLNQCPLSLAWTLLLLSHYSVRFTFPFFYLLIFCHSLASPLSFIPVLSGQ